MVSKNQARRAGDICAGKIDASNTEKEEARLIVDQWRMLHQEPLSRMIDEVAPVASACRGAILAGRLKKYSTIINKLSRVGVTHKLNSMYDIAGCRIIVGSLQEQSCVCELLQNIPSCDKELSAKHSYVTTPRDSGYRARHLIFNYSHSEGSMLLRSELQVRTLLQHQWATAVELYDSAKDTRLKFNECSNDQVKDFFLTSSKIIQAIENSSEVDRTFSFSDIDVARMILTTLESANESVWVTSPKEGNEPGLFYLLDFVKGQQTLQIEALEPDKAMQTYFSREKDTHSETHDVVLVRSDSFDALKLAYPNYFGNMSDFIELIKEYIE